MDLGECPKIHDLALRADYANASKDRDYFYDIDVSKKNVYVCDTLTRVDVNLFIYKFTLA